MGAATAVAATEEAHTMTRSLSSFWDELVACRDDLNLLLELIARRAAEIVGEASVLTIVSDDGNRLDPVAVYHPDPDIAGFIRTVLGSTSYRIGEGLAGNVAVRREPARLSRTDPDQWVGLLAPQSAEFLERYPMHAVLIVPMIGFGEVVGTLGVVRIEAEDPYTDEDVMVLETLAERAALALADVTHRPVRIGHAEYEAIFRQSEDGVLFTVPDGRVLAANPAACEILQLSEAEICARGRGRLLMADDPRTKAAIAQRALTGKVRTEVPMIRGNGETFVAELSSTIFSTSEGELRASVIFRDVTSRVRSQEQLATQHRYLQLLHNVTRDINQAADVASAIEFALGRICAVAGWPLGDAMLLTADGVLEPTSAWYVADPVRFRWFKRKMQRSVLSPGEGLAGYVVASKEAAWVSDLATDHRFVRRVELRDVPLHSYVGVPIMSGSEVRGVLEVFSDRPRQRDDQLLIVLSDLGTQLGRVIERARSEAVRRRIESDQAAFVARAAHELRSPVSALLLSADLLARQPPADERGETLVRLVLDSARHLARLVDRLLDLSEIDRGKPALAITRVDVAVVVDHALTAEPAPPGHTVVRDVPAGSWAVVDELSLEQVLTNLLRNAYNYGGPSVEIVAQHLNDHLRLTVADNGQGVDPEIEETLFEPFVRGPGEDVQGTGLGLAVSRRLAEAMGANLRYERRDGEGSRFSIDLPTSA